MLAGIFFALLATGGFYLLVGIPIYKKWLSHEQVVALLMLVAAGLAVVGVWLR